MFAAGAAAILLAFPLLRIPLLLTREPFFDELFTVWITRQGVGRMLELLTFDSGPPLYYLLVRGVFGWFDSGRAAVSLVEPVRFLSLIAGLATLLALLLTRRLGTPRYVASLLLVFYPPHLYFSTEARAYAFCSLLAGLGVLLLDRWAEQGRGMALYLGTAAILCAAYSHYYAVLFFPLPLILGVLSRDRRQIVRALGVTLGLAVLYAPGFWLASRQPDDAVRWMRSAGDSDLLIAALRHLGLAAPYPSGLLAPPPGWLQWGSLAGVIASLTYGMARSPRARRFALAAFVPLVLALTLVLAGKPAYFPMRFEAVTAVPFVLALSFSVAIMPVAIRRAVLVLLVAAGGWTSYRLVADRASWPEDPYRQTALFARAALLDQSVPIVASGPQYLEVISQTHSEWRPPILPFPSEQGVHPGWRANSDPAVLAKDRETLLPRVGRRFVWMGEWGSPEMRSLGGVLGSTVIFRRDPVVVLIMSGDGMEEQQQEHQPEATDKEEPDPRARP